MDSDDNNDYKHQYRFGWWPEIAGALGVALLLWYLITFARGSL